MTSNERIAGPRQQPSSRGVRADPTGRRSSNNGKGKTSREIRDPSNLKLVLDRRQSTQPMSVKTDIRNFLASTGQSTVSEIANGIGYSAGYVRQNAKEMVEDGTINGAKTKQIPAVIINGNYEVITDDRDHLLEIVRRHAPGKHGAAKSMSTRDLQDWIRDQLADQVVGGPRPWEFWV